LAFYLAPDPAPDGMIILAFVLLQIASAFAINDIAHESMRLCIVSNTKYVDQGNQQRIP